MELIIETGFEWGLGRACADDWREIMTRVATIVQIIVIVLIVGYGTYHLFRGNFEQTFATFPFLMVFYIFVIARRQRHRSPEDDDLPDN